MGGAHHAVTSGPLEAGVDLIHQALVLHGAFEAHLGRAAVADRATQVAIHRLVAADVAKARQEQPRPALAAGQHEGAVALERDDALAAEELRQAQRRAAATAPRASSRASRRPVVVLERHHHALGPSIGPGARHRRAIAVRRDDRRAEAAGQVQPVDAFLEERIAAGHRLVVAPVVGRLQAMGERREVREDHLADRRPRPAAAAASPPAACSGRSRRPGRRARRRSWPRGPSRSPPATETRASRPARACPRPAPAASARGGTSAARR